VTDALDLLESALQKIVQWSEAYPLEFFIEPYWKKAAEIAREALAQAERIERVDQALAAQLSRSISENAKLRQRIAELEQGQRLSTEIPRAQTP
jgi:cell division protein FtsB